MSKRNPREIKEANINWVDCDNLVTATVYQAKYINQLKKLAESHPEEVRIVAVNENGVVCAHLDKKYLRVSFGEPVKREMSEEQRKAASERFAKMWQDRRSNNREGSLSNA